MLALELGILDRSPGAEGEARLQDFARPPEGGEVVIAEIAQALHDGADPSTPAAREDPLSGRGRLDANSAAIAFVRPSAYEPLLLEPRHDARHRRRADALGLG